MDNIYIRIPINHSNSRFQKIRLVRIESLINQMIKLTKVPSKKIREKIATDILLKTIILHAE